MLFCSLWTLASSFDHLYTPKCAELLPCDSPIRCTWWDVGWVHVSMMVIRLRCVVWSVQSWHCEAVETLFKKPLLRSHVSRSSDSPPRETANHYFPLCSLQFYLIRYQIWGGGEFAALSLSSSSSPFQTKIFPLEPLSRMKQSSRISRSWANGLLSDTLVVVMEPVASDTWWASIQWTVMGMVVLKRQPCVYSSAYRAYLVEGGYVGGVCFAVLFWRAFW